MCVCVQVGLFVCPCMSIQPCKTIRQIDDKQAERRIIGRKGNSQLGHIRQVFFELISIIQSTVANVWNCSRSFTTE